MIGCIKIGFKNMRKTIVITLIGTVLLFAVLFYKELYLCYSHGIWLNLDWNTSLVIESAPDIKSGLVDVESDKVAETYLLMNDKEFLSFISNHKNTLQISKIDTSIINIQVSETAKQFPWSPEALKEAICLGFSNQYKGDYLLIKAIRYNEDYISVHLYTYWT